MIASVRFDRAQAPLPGVQDGARHASQNPIVVALNQMMVSVLGEQVREMFDRADDVLFDSAEKAQAAEEQRLFMDTMRTLRLQRARIIEHFSHSLEDALSRIENIGEDGHADIGDISQWSLQDGDALEERLAVSSMEGKAVAMHAHELGELKRRLASLSMLVGGSLSDEAMSPGRIIRAFRDSMKNLAVDFPSKLVIYKLFDRVVLSRLSELFTGANQLLALNGVEPVAGNSPRPATGANRARAPNRHLAAAPAWASQLDTATMGGFGVPQAGDGYDAPETLGGAAPSVAPAGWGGGPPLLPNESFDAALTHEIGHILHGYREGRRPDTPAWLPPESVALIATMFDRYYRDSRMTDTLKPMLGRLQLPIMKTALSDPSFFANVQHPARRAINDVFDLMLRFGTVENGDKHAAQSELHSLIDTFAASVRLDPQQLQKTRIAPVDEQAAETFIREQEELQHKKSDAQIERVRRIVAHELRRHVGERALAPGVMRLLLSGFGPMLSADYIRGGPGGASWRESIQLVDRVINSLQSTHGDAQQRRVEEAGIVATVSNRLARVGFSDSRLSEVIAGLLEVYLANEERRSEEPAAGGGDVSEDDRGEEQPMAAVAQLSPEKELQGLLSILLVPNTWYTLVDGDTATKHWVRVKTHYPAQHVVLFSHYMEPRFVRWRTTSLAAGLIDGRASLIDPSPELHSALARLKQIPFAHTHDPLEWTSEAGRHVEIGR
ncbi:MAG: DUF1631 family protein [Sinimarinibacterium sp.]